MAAAVAAHPTDSARPLSQHSLSLPIPHNSISSSSSPASSNGSSPSITDDEDITITGNRTLTKGKNPSQDDLKLLAVSAQITEITYSISDIQTRIFEIQELRHQAETEASSNNSSTAVIDQALINLDERLEAVSRSVQLVEETLEPVLRPVKTPTPGHHAVNATDNNLLRKHGALVAEWEAVQSEAETLRDELKEDKWLAVFRTVSEQADGMMASLEKAVTQCQDFIWQVQRQRDDTRSTASSAKSYQSDKNPINFEVYTALQNSFEAKKKYYIPSITKVLSVLDKGVRDRVTKNGECLRRHADMRSRWRNLHDRIRRIDDEMENARKVLVNQVKEPALSEASSTISRLTSKSSKQSNLGTPSPSRTSTLSRSMSPIRKFAAKVASGLKSGRGTPTLSPSPQARPRVPVSEPSSRRTSFFQTFRSPQPAAVAPPLPTNGRKSVSGRAPEESGSSTLKAKPRWNGSTKVEDDHILPSQPPTLRKKSSATALTSAYAVRPPLPNVPPRSRTPSSNPNSSNTSPANYQPMTPSPRPSSRPPSRSASPFGGLPKARPQTPSQIPAPSYRGFGGSQYSASSSDDYDQYGHTSILQRAFSPSGMSASASARGTSPPTTPIAAQTLRRKASNSKIPVPTFQVNPASRPGSSMSLNRSPSPSLSVSGSASPNRSQTPEVVVKARAGQMPFYGASARPRQSYAPSSFRDGSTPLPRIPPSNSRPSSRTGNVHDRSFTPSLDQNPVPQYVPVSTKDPLDVEVAKVVNGIAHGFLIERVDPPMRTPPSPGEELKAQYAFSNAYGKKVISCRLVVINRSDTQTRKVMCRVGGGWLDLQMYLLNRQAGLQ